MCYYFVVITWAVKQGVNKATVIVGNTLAQEVKDRFSKFLQLEPSGILKEIKLFSSK